MHVPTTGLEVAQGAGRARASWSRRATPRCAWRASPRSPNEPAPFKAARDARRALDDDLEARIPSLTINVKNVPDGTTADGDHRRRRRPRGDARAAAQARSRAPRHRGEGGHGRGQAGGRHRREGHEERRRSSCPRRPAAACGDRADRSRDDGRRRAGAPRDVRRRRRCSSFGGFGLAGAGVDRRHHHRACCPMSKTSSIKSSRRVPGATSCSPRRGQRHQLRQDDGDDLDRVVHRRGRRRGGWASWVSLTAARPRGSRRTSLPMRPPRRSDEPSRVVPWIGLGAAGMRGTF